MAKKRKMAIRALPPATAPPVMVKAPKPQTETVVIHTTRERKRNADGGGSWTSKAVIPIVGGIAGGAATVLATSKLNLSPLIVAGAGTAAGIAVASTAKTPWVKQAAMGMAIGASALGGVTLVGNLLAGKPAPPVAAGDGKDKKKRAADGWDGRDAEGDGFVTRKELNDALSKVANAQQEATKEATKQQTCELRDVLREEIKRVLAETQAKEPAKDIAPRAMRYTMPFGLRDADGDDYMRNAYGEDVRDAAGDDYMRNAYGEDVRDAAGDDDYMRNAYADEYRDAAGDEYRDAAADEYRDAAADEYRDAPGDEYRDATADEPTW